MGGRTRPCAPREPRLRRLIPALWALGSAGLVVATAPADAGAWPQEKGEGLLVITTLMDRADQGFGPDGETVDDGYFYKDETAAYLEYGLTARTTWVSRVAWQSVERRQGSRVDAARGLSASELALRHQVWSDGPDTLSFQAGVLLPGSGENVSNQPLGSGETAWEARALWGRRLSPSQFADVQLSHRWRGGEDLNEARLDLTWGWQPAERWQVLAQSFSVWSVEAARPGRPEFQQHKLQVSVGRQWGDVEYHLGIAATPAGRNVINERMAFLSVWRRF